MDTITLMYIQTALQLIIAVGVVIIAYSLREGDPPNWPGSVVTAKNAMKIPPHSKKMADANDPLILSKIKPPASLREQIDWLSCLQEKMFRELEVIREK